MVHPRRVLLEILWLRADGDPDLFRDLLVEKLPAETEPPLALLICESPGELADAFLDGIELRITHSGRNPQSESECQVFARSRNFVDRWWAAQAEGCPAFVLDSLALDETVPVRLAVVDNPDVSVETLRMLAAGSGEDAVAASERLVDLGV